jgi:Flp pilus assembly protein TadG
MNVCPDSPPAPHIGSDSRSRRIARRGRAVSRRLRGESGVAMVEFALIVPVLFVLIFGIIYLGRYINYQADETHLASEAARYAAVAQVPDGCTSTLASCVRSQAEGELLNGSSDVSAVSVCVTNGTGGSGNVGDPVTVTVTSAYSFLPILGIATVTDAESATMRLEEPLSAAPNILGCAS